MGISTRLKRILIATVCSSSITGCSLHPLPEDFSGVSTYSIVQHIRCETREAVIDILADRLSSPKLDDYYHIMAQRIIAEPDYVRTLTPDNFRDDVRPFIVRFQQTSLAYNFELIMTNNNNANITANVPRIFTATFGALGANVGSERRRQTTRTFTITDNFLDLVAAQTDKLCEPYLVTENYIYPMTGKIGIYAVIDTFVDLVMDGKLGKQGTPNGPPTMGEALEFRTHIVGSATPKIVFSEAGSGLDVADISSTLSASRTDTHTVTIALALPVPPGKATQARVSRGAAPATAGTRATARNAPLTPPSIMNIYNGTLLNATGNNTELEAARAVDQQLLQRALQQRTIILDR